jgi:hypothetical protein
VKLCNPDCLPACDFCVHLDRRDGDEGESLCLLLGEVVDWGSYCEDFHCFRVEEESVGNETR